MNVIGPFAKKLENLLFSKTVVIGKSSSKWPGASSCTVTTKVKLDPSRALSQFEVIVPIKQLFASLKAVTKGWGKGFPAVTTGT